MNKQHEDNANIIAEREHRIKSIENELKFLRDEYDTKIRDTEEKLRISLTKQSILEEKLLSREETLKENTINHEKKLTELRLSYSQKCESMLCDFSAGREKIKFDLEEKYRDDVKKLNDKISDMSCEQTKKINFIQSEHSRNFEMEYSNLQTKYNAEVERLKTQILSLNTEHNRIVDTLKAENARNMDNFRFDLCRKHKAEVEELNAKITFVISENSRIITRQNSEHTRKIEAMRFEADDRFKSEISRLNKLLENNANDYNRKMVDIQSEHERKINKMQNDFDLLLRAETEKLNCKIQELNRVNILIQSEQVERMNIGAIRKTKEGENHVKKLENEIEEKNKEFIILREQYNTLKTETNGKIQSLIKENIDLQAKATSVSVNTETINDLKKIIGNLNENITELQKSAKYLEKTHFEEMRNVRTDCEIKLTESGTTIVRLETEIKRMREEFAAKLTSITNIHEKTKKNLETASVMLNQREDENRKFSEQNRTLINKISIFENSVTELNKRLNEAVNERNELRYTIEQQAIQSSVDVNYEKRIKAMREDFIAKMNKKHLEVESHDQEIEKLRTQLKITESLYKESLAHNC